MSVEVLASLVSALGVIVGALAVAYSRIAARLARLEEWVRVTERRNGTSRPPE